MDSQDKRTDDSDRDRNDTDSGSGPTSSKKARIGQKQTKMLIKTYNLHSLMRDSFQDHELKDCKVVVDGQNFFYRTYQNARIPYAFGSECDRYAEYLKQHLSMFKKANVTAYFVFKGGHKDIESRIKKSVKQYNSTAKHYIPGQNPIHIHPILMKETYAQVLDEMGFPYVVCECEAKAQCIALAQKHSCPIISHDKEFYLSSVPYIQYMDVRFQANDNTILCKMFELNRFLKTHKITDLHLAIFIVLANNDLPQTSVKKIFKKLRLSSDNDSILRWLSGMTSEAAVKTIFGCLDYNERVKFISLEKEAREFIRRQEPAGVPIDYLENGEDIIDHCDPLWFEKGVACRYIPIIYINLYRSDILWGSWAIQDHEADDAMTLSLDIVKYAYKLLTNSQKQKFTLLIESKVRNEISVSQARPLVHSGSQCYSVFQNGWDQLNGTALFDNFLVEIFGRDASNVINQLPEDAKLLIISLVYFSRMKRVNTINEVSCIMLSYVMLGVVHEIHNDKVTVNSLSSGKSLTLDVLINKSNFKSDCREATISMNDYFKLSDSELVDIFDRKLLHPLVEFQHCLEHMNFLNRLCGSPYKPTIYRKTYNGTFVYKMLHALKKESAADAMSFLEGKLQSSPIILEYIKSLMVVYKAML